MLVDEKGRATQASILKGIPKGMGLDEVAIP
jgi:hypothetical protein